MTRATIALAMLTFAPASCGTERPHNSQYYLDHPDARADMLKRCAKDQNTEDPAGCLAAEDARMIAIGGK